MPLKRGSAGIGRQAGLRCLCPTIDVRVQVSSPAPKKNHLSGWFFFCCQGDRNPVRAARWAAHEPARTTVLPNNGLILFGKPCHYRAFRFTLWYSGLCPDRISLGGSRLFSFQKNGAVCIFFDVSVLIVLRCVQRNDKFCSCAVEISDIFSRHLLPKEPAAYCALAA